MTEYGLVLSSDGSKSSFEIGAWKALRELDIEITAVSGSFVGALNAALIAQGDFERAVRFWRNVFSKNLFHANITIAHKYTSEWSKSDTKSFKRSFLRYIQCETEELAPLKELLDIFIDERRIRKSPIKLGFVSVSQNTLEAELITLDKIPRNKLTTYLLVAACFPQIVQVNSAQDPQFSARYSPYNILENFGVNQILSTDEVLITPPGLRAEVETIQSSEALVLDLRETAEKMKKNIKLGYMDTLKLFEQSMGEIFFIEGERNHAQVTQFETSYAKPFHSHLDILIRLILKIENNSTDTIATRTKQLKQFAGYKNEDSTIAMFENLARILRIDKEIKYTPEILLNNIRGQLNLLLGKNKQKLSDITYIRKLIIDAAEPANQIPDPDTFIQYCLVLIACNPTNYRKMQPFINILNPKVTLGIITVLYLLY